MKGLGPTILDDLRAKAGWNYEQTGWRAIVKTLGTDGTLAMILYRLMQWSVRHRLGVLALVFNKLNTVFSNCIIGRGADFGERFVLIHATGIVVNADVRGGDGVFLEHQVTIGAERRQAPTLGNDVFVGAGARIIGAVHVGDGARVGANAVVVHDVPAHCTAVGVPARVIARPHEGGETGRTSAPVVAFR